jgi:RND family efflux transporter MFP subunit
MRKGNLFTFLPVAIILLAWGLISFPVAAQQPQKGEGGGMPPAQVRYTPAREHNLRRLLTLSGTVEARTTSTIAATVPGQVVEFLGNEGLRVKAGDPLARLRTVTLELTLAARRADLKEADARLKQAETNLGRAKELFAATVIPREQLDDRQSEVNAWQGRVESLRAEIRRIEDEVDRCTVRAPFNGVVVREHTEVGQWLNAGNPVVELLALDQVEVRVEVPERFFVSLREGTVATLTIESLPNRTFQGKVIAVVPRADAQARTFPVKVLVGNERQLLGAGMLAQVSFPVGESYAATVVPKDAVISQGPQKFVYRLNGDNTVDLVAVETGNAAGVWLEVRGNLRPGDKIITRGNERLRPGMFVQGAPLEYARP